MSMATVSTEHSTNIGRGASVRLFLLDYLHLPRFWAARTVGEVAAKITDGTHIPLSRYIAAGTQSTFAYYAEKFNTTTSREALWPWINATGDRPKKPESAVRLEIAEEPPTRSGMVVVHFLLNDIPPF